MGAGAMTGATAERRYVVQLLHGAWAVLDTSRCVRVRTWPDEATAADDADDLELLHMAEDVRGYDGGMDLPWHDVSSSNVRRVAHQRGICYVEFLNGGVYAYDGVSAEVYAELLAAPSTGAFVARRLRGQYLAQRMDTK